MFGDLYDVDSTSSSRRELLEFKRRVDILVANMSEICDVCGGRWIDNNIQDKNVAINGNLTERKRVCKYCL